jgi:molybdopterin converting factor small subunit
MSMFLTVGPSLRRFTGGEKTIEVSGSTVGEVILGVGEDQPGFLSEVLADDGSFRSNLHVTVNEEPIAWLDGLATELADGDVLIIDNLVG